jgi:uncharacterized membrane protein
MTAAIFATVVFSVSAWHWWSFQYRTFDLAFYVQGLWLAVRGQWHVSLLGVSVLGNHVEPLVFLLTPLFALCPHPLVLVAVQSAALATMPFTAWRIARQLGIEEKAASWLAVSTVLMPATGFVGLHEFHPEAFAAPLLLLLIEARLAGRLGWFWVWLAAVLACKENMAPLLVAWGAVHALWDWRRSVREQWLWNVAPLLAAAAWFVICTRVITPALNAGKVDYLELYSHLGSSGGEIVGRFFHEPQIALGALGRSVTQGNLVWGLLVPLLALSLLRPRWLLIGTPILLQHLLSWRASEWSLNFHYAAPLIPLVWMAAAEAVAASRRAMWVGRAVALACAVAQFAFGPARVIVAELPSVRQTWQERAVLARAVAAVPAQASVSAAIRLLPHLAGREKLYSLHHVLKGLNTLSRARYQPPAPPDCVLIDYADTATFDPAAGFYHPTMRTVAGEIVPSSDQLLHEFLRTSTWRATSVNTVTLLQQAPHEEPREIDEATDIPLDATTTLRSLTWQGRQGAVRLKRESARTFASNPDAGETATLRLVWAFAGERKTFPWLTLLLKGEGGEFLLSKGLCAIEASESTVENWHILAPPSIPVGRFRVRAFFTDRASPQATPKILQTRDLGEVEVTNDR